MSSFRRFLIAGGFAAAMMRLYGSAPSDGARAVLVAIAVVVALLVLFVGRSAGPGTEESLEHEGLTDPDDDEGSDTELLRATATHGGSLRSPGGTLVLKRRTLHFTHVRGELVLPIDRVASVTKGRTLMLFDNQIVLTLRDGRREVFQLSEDRDVWLRALKDLVPTKRSAYR